MIQYYCYLMLKQQNKVNTVVVFFKKLLYFANLPSSWRYLPPTLSFSKG